MSLTPPIVAVLAALSLLVSLLSLVLHRRDKGSEKLQQTMREQKESIQLVDATVHRRIDDLTRITSTWEAANGIRHNAAETKLAGVDERLKHVLDHRDIEQLQRGISDVAASVGQLRGALESNTRMTERINTFLMERDK